MRPFHPLASYTHNHPWFSVVGARAHDHVSHSAGRHHPTNESASGLSDVHWFTGSELSPNFSRATLCYAPPLRHRSNKPDFTGGANHNMSHEATSETTIFANLSSPRQNLKFGRQISNYVAQPVIACSPFHVLGSLPRQGPR